jgi:integrator complex subunit 7
MSFPVYIFLLLLIFSPPPAIAQALAQHSRDHLQKFGHITNQLRKSIKIMKQVEDSYAKLYKSSFDADPCSLEYLEMYVSKTLFCLKI